MFFVSVLAEKFTTCNHLFQRKPACWLNSRFFSTTTTLNSKALSTRAWRGNPSHFCCWKHHRITHRCFYQNETSCYQRNYTFVVIFRLFYSSIISMTFNRHLALTSSRTQRTQKASYSNPGRALYLPMIALTNASLVLGIFLSRFYVSMSFTVYLISWSPTFKHILKHTHRSLYLVISKLSSFCFFFFFVNTVYDNG